LCSLTVDILPALWKDAGLGVIHSVARPQRGSVNLCWIVNDAYVIRFDTSSREVSRFESEAIVYRRLAGSGIPVPEVVRLDVSKRLTPYHYLITTKLAGTPIIDSWPQLPESKRVEAARAAGGYLARLHEYGFDFIGKLRSSGSRFPGWYAYVEDYYRRYAIRALQQAILSPSITGRIEAVLQKHKPRLEAITQGFLVHSDYQFENILQQNGQITGIIDFEWAFAGDPTADFCIQFRWDEMCPGSVQPLREGYASKRPFDADHEIRRRIYELLTHVETIAAWVDPANVEQVDRTRRQLLDTLRGLE